VSHFRNGRFPEGAEAPDGLRPVAEDLLARACIRTHRISAGLYTVSLGFFGLGAAFAFILPLFGV
jgi:hypothetical protein